MVAAPGRWLGRRGLAAPRGGRGRGRLLSATTAALLLLLLLLLEYLGWLLK